VPVETFVSCLLLEVALPLVEKKNKEKKNITESSSRVLRRNLKSDNVKKSLRKRKVKK